MNKERLQGTSILLLTTALYGLYGIYARLIALEFDVFSQNWVRNIFVMSLASVLIFLSGQRWIKIAKKDIPWIGGWILCDILFVIVFFITLNHLTIGAALFLLYSGSTISGYAAGTLF